MDSSPSNQLLFELNQAKSSLHNLKAEETHWKQKSRNKWSSEGNKNTKFFHLSAKICSNFNTVDRIAVNNTTIANPVLIKSAAARHFETTFEARLVKIQASLFNCDHNNGVSLAQNTLL